MTSGSVTEVTAGHSLTTYRVRMHGKFVINLGLLPVLNCHSLSLYSRCHRCWRRPVSLESRWLMTSSESTRKTHQSRSKGLAKSLKRCRRQIMYPPLWLSACRMRGSLLGYRTINDQISHKRVQINTGIQVHVHLTAYKAHWSKIPSLHYRKG